MVAFNLNFVPLHKNEETFEAAGSFISLLARFEHIYPNYVLRWVQKTLIGTVIAIYSDSLKSEKFNRYIQNSLNELQTLLKEKPRFKNETQLVNKEPSLKQASSLYLGANFLSENPVLKSGDNDAFIPLYMLPMDPDFIEKLSFWGNNYRRYDGIQMSCHALEMPAYKQLAHSNSELSQEGRNLCEMVEKEIGKPVYYYLSRYWGYPDAEEKKRKCPNCNKPWVNPEWKHKGLGLTGYYFKCDGCRLISELGSTDENRRYAKIGTYKG